MSHFILKIQKKRLHVSKVVREKHNRIIELLSRATDVTAHLITEGQVQDCLVLLSDCQGGAVALGTDIEKRYGLNTQTLSTLEQYCEALYQLSVAIQEDGQVKETEDLLKDSMKNVKETYAKEFPDKLEIVFMPYKASMWTSLESIYKAALKDERCDVHVIPIPYYELDKNCKEKKLVYEKDLFPKDVVIESHEDYKIEDRKPDVIYIHNPYDQYNTLTHVLEDFYSVNLKKHTDCLVYSPYALESRVEKRELIQFKTPGYYYADKIIVQNEKMKKLCLKYNIPEEKFICYGSPKLDALVDCFHLSDDNEFIHLKDKKVILLNTHLLYFTVADEVIYKAHLEIIGKTIEFIELSEELALIWRPHPLMISWIEKTYPERLKDVKNLFYTIEKSKKCVLDWSSDYRAAFQISYAMISTFSSLITEYMVLKKPIYIIQNAPEKEQMQHDVVDYSGNYFRTDKDVNMLMNAKTFLDMMEREEDPLKVRRERIVQRDFSSYIGEIGQMIHNEIMREIW